MKHWLNIGILLVIYSISLKAQTIDINANGVQANLSVTCLIGSKQIAYNGQAFVFNPKQINQGITLKIKLNGINPEDALPIKINLKGSNSVSLNEPGGSDQLFPPNLTSQKEGRWTLLVSSGGQFLKEHGFKYIVEGGKSEPGANASEVVVDSLQLAWDKAKRIQTTAGYEAFIKKYPKSKYTAEAKKAIERLKPLEANITAQDENSYTIQFFPVLAAMPVARLNGDSMDIDFQKVTDKDYLFEGKFALADSKKYTLELFDPARSNNQSRYALEIDNTFRIGTEEKAGKNRKLKLIGGKPPYQAQFLQKNVSIHTFPIKENPWVISAENHQGHLNPGTYDIKLRDAHLIDSVYIDAGQIVIASQPVTPNWKQWMPYISGVVAFIVLCVLVMVVRVRNRTKKIKAAQARQQEVAKQATLDPDSVTTPATVLEETIPVIANGISDAESLPSPMIIQPILEQEARKRFSIRAKTGVADEKLEESTYFKALMHSKQYSMIPLSKTWADSAISHVYLSRESIKTLDDFLWKENILLVSTKGANIPEIGGMLLGRYAIDSQKGSYVVAIEKFVPIQARFQNVYQLAFDPLSIAEEVSKITDENPEFRIMGWFHTHPGHGLFLSKQDLEIQEHYREPFHFAMEIDSLSENLDTGFFTRTKQGVINNQENRLPGTRWFSWLEIKSSI